MPVTILTENGAEINGQNPVDVEYGVEPTPGNLMVVILFTRSPSVATPDGWVKDESVGTPSNEFAYFHRVAGVGEGLSQPFAVGNTNQGGWTYLELVGVNPASPVRASASENFASATTERSSGTTDGSPVSGDFAIAGFASRTLVLDQTFSNGFVFLREDGRLEPNVGQVTTATLEVPGGEVETTMTWVDSAQTRGAVVVYIPLAEEGGITSVFNGADYVPVVSKVWDGARWVPAVEKIWDGTQWVGT